MSEDGEGAEFKLPAVTSLLHSRRTPSQLAPAHSLGDNAEASLQGAHTTTICFLNFFIRFVRYSMCMMNECFHRTVIR